VCLLCYDIGQEKVCLFVRELLRQLSGRLIVLQDNSSTHNGHPIEQLPQRTAACASNTFLSMRRS
jgi:hypothetical protein